MSFAPLGQSKWPCCKPREIELNRPRNDSRMVFLHPDPDFYRDISRSEEMGAAENRQCAGTKISYTAIKKRLDSEPDLEDAGHPSFVPVTPTF